MIEKYLIIKVRFKGIEKLCFLTRDPKITLEERSKAIKKDITEEKKRHELLLKRIPNLSWKGRPDKEIAERFCIQKWDGKEFDCCCKELGVKGIDETMFFNY